MFLTLDFDVLYWPLDGGVTSLCPIKAVDLTASSLRSWALDSRIDGVEVHLA